MQSKSLPTLIAGPIVRHLDKSNVTFWLVTTHDCAIECIIQDAQSAQVIQSTSKTSTWQLGTNAFIKLVNAKPEQVFKSDCLYEYDLMFSEDNKASKNLHEIGFDAIYKTNKRPSFRLKQTLTQVIHGSCRKAHFKGNDALPQLDKLIEAEFSSEQQRPDIALFTGDQVYIDDVAGPMLNAVHQVIKLLGMRGETFEGARVNDLQELIKHPDGYYRRESLLPEVEANENLANAFFKAKRKPVFTSVNAQNHLIALSEMLALYFLSWSPTLWEHIDIDTHSLNGNDAQKYQDELEWINNFKKDLPAVQRAMAHVPIYMIFDDHDVTDDWNLTRGWEEHIYGHPFSKRIIGNALCAYFLCQGSGNPQTKLTELFEQAKKTFNSDAQLEHESFLEALLEFSEWHYELDTTPAVHVLDTRTQRWRSESSLNKPSGLMDWEALCELQSSLIGKEAVIMVSAAPVYGVKFIEAVQRVFTMFGGALTVDAENWMAHRGTASVMLNIFRHIKTPPNFVILSGDVHYSFVYDVKLRFRRNSPHITQFTSSGIHNEFPPTLLSWFDRLNQWFYGRRSPLNWLTKRRNMSVRQRKPIGQAGYLVNQSNLGRLHLNHDASEVKCELVCSDGTIVSFDEDKDT